MSFGSFGVAGTGPTDGDRSAELSDIGRYGRYLLRRFVTQARTADQPTFRSVLGAHLAAPTHDLPVVLEHWPAYEHVNVQAALDVVLADHGDAARVIGMTGHRHFGPFGMADLLNEDPRYAAHGPRPGNVTWTSLPSGPGGQTRECLRAAGICSATTASAAPCSSARPTPSRVCWRSSSRTST